MIQSEIINDRIHIWSDLGLKIRQVETGALAVSLYAEVLIPDPSEIPEWVQPSSTNPYMIGDKVRHNGHIWISTIDYNVFEPGVAGWEEV